jgi:hypothetical protein
MLAHPLRRRGLIASLVLGLAPVLFAPADAAPAAVKTDYYKGKVVPLAGLVEKFGTRLDADAAPNWLALVTDDGKVYPLIKDEGSRMFYKDTRLLNRPMRLSGRVLPGSQLLQVLHVQSYVKDELCEVYYWCDICSIKRFEKKACDCCGAPMELREVPVKK